MATAVKAPRGKIPMSKPLENWFSWNNFPPLRKKKRLVFGSWRVCTASWEGGLQWLYVFNLFGFQHKKTLSPSPLLHHVRAILSTSHFGFVQDQVQYTLIYASFREMMAWILMVPPFGPIQLFQPVSTAPNRRLKVSNTPDTGIAAGIAR